MGRDRGEIHWGRDKGGEAGGTEGERDKDARQRGRRGQMKGGRQRGGNGHEGAELKKLNGGERLRERDARERDIGERPALTFLGQIYCWSAQS